MKANFKGTNMKGGRVRQFRRLMDSLKSSESGRKQLSCVSACAQQTELSPYLSVAALDAMLSLCQGKQSSI